MEHIEEAGIHSGDSACSLPPYTPRPPRRSPRSSGRPSALARALDVVGLMNVQFAIKDGEVYVLEVNPRASRTVPFVAKATGVPLAKIAARVMAGETLAELRRSRSAERAAGHVAVKEAVFPFARFPGVDPILGPEMKSTGEVMGLDVDFGRAFAKSQLGAGTDLPLAGHASSSRCATATRRRWSSRAASSQRGASSWSRPAAPRQRSARRACRCDRSTRCRKAGRISST